MRDVRVRTAKPADAEALAATYRDAYRRNRELGVAKLSRFGVREARKGEGIGSRHLAVAEDVARERGDERVRLTTPEEHPFLVTFYESRGYVVVADYPLEFRDYDEVVLERALD